MRITVNSICAVACLLAASSALHAQQFSLFGKDVQVHGFAAQGFAYSNQNNYLAMKTSDGSFAFTDGGINISARLTKNFRVGAQFYDRNVGELGKWHPQVDWAYGDYKVSDQFGIRAGKVKTVFGLFNDTQDAEFLHTWALLPQSTYPLDLRGDMIAHTGGDFYGEISLRKAGSLAYTVYAGTKSIDLHGGSAYAIESQGLHRLYDGGLTAGGDLRWNTAFEGLMAGGSWMNQTYDRSTTGPKYGNIPVILKNNTNQLAAVYVDFLRGKWHLNSEFRTNKDSNDVSYNGKASTNDSGTRGWFASAAYRVTKKLEVGTYHSRFYVHAPRTTDPNANHIFDQTLTARLDITKFWNMKVEGHFIDGYGDTYSAHGFYPSLNSAGLKPTTHLLVVRTGFNF